MSSEPLALATRPLRSLASVHLRSLTLNPLSTRRGSSSSSSSADTLRRTVLSQQHQHQEPRCVCVLSRDSEVLWASPSTPWKPDQDYTMHFDSNEHVAGQPGLYGGSSVSLDLWVWNDQPATVGKGKQRAVDDEQDDWVLLLKYHVHLDHLVPLGATPSTFPCFPPDSLILQFNDHKDFWLVPSQQPQPQSGTQQRQAGERSRRVSAATPDDLFALLSLEQLLVNSRARIYDQEQFAARWDVWERLRGVRQAQEEVRELRQFLSETQEANRRLTEQVQSRRDQQAQRHTRLQAAHQRLSLSRERLHATRTDTTRLQSELSFTRTALGDIRATHLAALEFIFDIQPTAAALLFSLFSGLLPLPNSEGLTEEHASALGVTALLVNLLAAFLGVGLNYPLLFSGSRSLAVDPISLIKGPRSFPLYAYGVEDYRFHYAVFLLNKDVEQLCLSEHVLCTDLRQTLPNLTNLILTVTGRSKAPRGRKTIKVDSSSGRREGYEGSLREAITSPTTPRGAAETNGSRSTSPASTVRGHHPRPKGADSPTPSEKIRLVTKPASVRSLATATDKERPTHQSTTTATNRT